MTFYASATGRAIYHLACTTNWRPSHALKITLFSHYWRDVYFRAALGTLRFSRQINDSQYTTNDVWWFQMQFSSAFQYHPPRWALLKNSPQHSSQDDAADEFANILHKVGKSSLLSRKSLKIIRATWFQTQLHDGLHNNTGFISMRRNFIFMYSLPIITTAIIES